MGDRTIGCTKETEGCKNFNEGIGDNINKLAKEFCEVTRDKSVNDQNNNFDTIYLDGSKSMQGTT